MTASFYVHNHPLFIPLTLSTCTQRVSSFRSLHVTHLEWRLFSAVTPTEHSEGCWQRRETGLWTRLGLLDICVLCWPWVGASRWGNMGRRYQSVWGHDSRKCQDNSDVTSSVLLSLIPEPAVDRSFLCIPIVPEYSSLIFYLQNSSLKGRER